LFHYCTVIKLFMCQSSLRAIRTQ